jgi:hypothetical protein
VRAAAGPEEKLADGLAGHCPAERCTNTSIETPRIALSATLPRSSRGSPALAHWRPGLLPAAPPAPPVPTVTGDVVGRDPDDEHRRVLAMNKTNLGPTPKSLAYKLLPNDEGIVRIGWLGEMDLRPAVILWHATPNSCGDTFQAATVRSAGVKVPEHSVSSWRAARRIISVRLMGGPSCFSLPDATTCRFRNEDGRGVYCGGCLLSMTSG